MHELSIVMGIVDLATKQALANGAILIEEIELEIGCLSGIEMDSFEFACLVARSTMPMTMDSSCMSSY